MIYLDHNATRPMHPAVLEAMARAAQTAWGNPSSLHAAGRAARRVLDEAREAIAVLLAAHARDVILTSGGTEANNLGITSRFPDGRGVLLTSELEHPSVLALAEELRRRGVIVKLLPVSDGCLQPSDIARLFEEANPAPGAPRLVATHAVQPETGTLQPVAALIAAAEAAGAELHLDAVQAAGRIEPSLYRGAHSVALAAHKLQGPKGIGALVTRPGVPIRPLVFGGAQERGLRPGTPDPIAAAGFAAAARLALTTPAAWAAVGPLRDQLESALLALELPGPGGGGESTRHASPVATVGEPRAPHVVHVSFPGWAGDELVAALDLEGVCISAGSACSAGTSEPSRAVSALRGDAHARSSVRISLGSGTTADEVATALAAFRRVLARR